MTVATPAVAANFAGPRAEVRLGWDRTRAEVSALGENASAHDDGFSAGAEAGYDLQLGGTALVGAYGGVDFATTKECTEVYGSDEACLKLGRNFSLGARLGAAVSPKALVYVKGGYSNGQLKATYVDQIDPTNNSTDKASRDDFHVGLGAEYAVSPTGYLKAEVVRINYNDYDYSDPDLTAKLDTRRTQVLVGFGLRF